MFVWLSANFYRSVSEYGARRSSYALLDKGVRNHEKQACCTAIFGGGGCSSVFSPDRDGIVAVGRSVVQGSGSRSARRGTGRGWPHSRIERYRIRVFHQEPRYVPGSGRCCPGLRSEDESRPILRWPSPTRTAEPISCPPLSKRTGRYARRGS